MTSHLGVPAASYTYRAPSPPAVLIPTPSLHSANDPIKAVPRFDDIDPSSLSAEDFRIITQNSRAQLAHDSAMNWAYESRRTAQPVLDYLYLGPSSVARNIEWLRKEGFTMLLAARDSHMAEARLMNVNKVAQELGIAAEYVDVGGYHELIRAFPATVRKINDHMLRVFRSQALDVSTADGNMTIDQTSFRRGKVLVFCESGNDRSAGVVCAYLMAVYGMDMVKACQFVLFKRFCVNLEEELKQILLTWQDILRARNDITRYNLQHPPEPTPATAPAVSYNDHGHPLARRKSKRAIEDTMDEDDDRDGGNGTPGGHVLDHDRYADRQVFVPFVESQEEHMEGS